MCIRDSAYELEPRVLFSAAPIPVEMAEGMEVNDLTDNALFDNADLMATDDGSQTFPQIESDDDPLVGLSESFGVEQTTGKEFVFIDDMVADFESISSQIKEEFPDATVVVLDSQLNGIEQITDALDEERHVSAVHFLSHGNDGSVQLGNSSLSTDTVGMYTDAIVQWSQSLTLDADLYFYGCNLASNDAGVELLESLEAITGADLAASDDLTGHESLGGDWDLEYRTGELKDSGFQFADIAENWSLLLATDAMDPTDPTSADPQANPNPPPAADPTSPPTADPMPAPTADPTNPTPAPVNNAPFTTIPDLVINGNEDLDPLFFDLRATVTDADGDPLSVANFNPVAGDQVGVSLSADGNFLTVNADAYSFLSEGETEVLRFSYDVIDGRGGEVARELTVAIDGINDAPEFTAGLVVPISEDAPGLQTIDLLSGISDDESDALTVSRIDYESGDDSGITVVGNTLLVDPSVYNGLNQSQTETVTYRYEVTDGQDVSTIREVLVQINGENDTPVVTSTITQDFEFNSGIVEIDLLEHSFDPDNGEMLDVISVTQTTGDLASTIIAGNQVFVDTDRLFQTFGDSNPHVITFTYQVTDDFGAFVDQTATIITVSYTHLTLPTKA